MTELEKVLEVLKRQKLHDLEKFRFLVDFVISWKARPDVYLEPIVVDGEIIFKKE